MLVSRCLLVVLIEPGEGDLGDLMGAEPICSKPDFDYGVKDLLFVRSWANAKSQCNECKKQLKLLKLKEGIKNAKLD